MKRIGHFLVIPVLLLFSMAGSAQIVNTENAKMDTDTIGWKGSISASLGLSKYIDNILTTNFGIHIQHKTKKGLWILLGEANFLKVAESKYVDERFLHMRYALKMARRFHWEFFTQIENNLVVQLKSRWIVGTGPRMKLFSNKFIHLHIATQINYEQENEGTVPVTKHSDFRSSSYISFTIIPAQRVEINSTTFFQPLLSNFSDSRVLNQVQLKVTANKHFGTTLQWNYFHDRYPVKSVPETQYSFRAGITYDF